MSLEQQALDLQVEHVRQDACDMPAAFALLFGGPNDGERYAVEPNLPFFHVPLPVSPTLSILDASLPDVDTADYQRGSWVTLTHNLPWCQKNHEVIEYRYAGLSYSHR